MKSGLTSVTFRKLSAAEIIVLCANAGLDGIEWGGDIHAPAGNTDAAGALGIATAQKGLTVSSYGSYYSPLRGGEDEYMKEFYGVSETARALGCGVIRIWAGGKAYADCAQNEVYGFITRMKAVAGAAGKAGQTVCFEFHKNTLNDSPEHTLMLLEAIGASNVKTYFQPVEEAEAESLKAIRMLDGLIENVHVFNWVNGERLPLREGVKRWQKYIAALSAARAKNLILEFVQNDDPAIFLKDAATLKELLRACK